MTHMQRYMCSRFFIDYKTIREQLHVIAQYVGTHYLPSSITTNFYTANNSNEIAHIQYYLQHRLINSKYGSEQIDPVDLMNARLCLLFLEHLGQVIQQSTVCLTHEDRQLLQYNIYLLKDHYYFEYDRLSQTDAQHFQKYHAGNHSQYRHYSSSNSSRSVMEEWNFFSPSPLVFQSSPSSLSSKSYGAYRSYAQRNHRHPTNPSYGQARNYPNGQGAYRQKQSWWREIVILWCCNSLRESN